MSSVSVSDPSVPPGAPITVTVVLDRADTGASLPNEPVTLTAGGNTLNGTTDSTGTAVFNSYAPAVPGSYTLTANFAGDATLGYAPSSGSAILTVTSAAGIPVAPLAIVVAAAAAIGIAVYIGRSRKT